MKILPKDFSNQTEVEKYLIARGNSKEGAKILSNKSRCLTLEIKNIDTRAANILKQDAISVGADCALPRDATSFRIKKTDVLLIGNLRTLKKLMQKLKMQPFGLSELSVQLEKVVENLSQKTFVWRLPSKKLELSEPLVMGILNTTPDSFSDGGLFNKIDSALKRAEQMLSEGADIIDVGGESTRPGAEPVSLQEEISRTIPVIREIKRHFPQAIVSIDTYKAEVAELALSEGAEIVNDISGLGFDKRMPKVVSDFKAGVVIMHIKGTPKNMQKDPYYEDVVDEVYSYFEDRVKLAREHSIRDDQIVLDPGIGFGKRLEDNLCLLKNLSAFKSLGFPILVGTSRKSFIGILTGVKVPSERLAGTLGSVGFAALKGADIFRVHDVKETVDFLKVFKALEESRCF